MEGLAKRGVIVKGGVYVQEMSKVDTVTLGLIVAAVFSFGVAGLYSFVLIFSTPARHVKIQSHRQRSEVFFALGLSILLLEPSLILFTLDYAILGVIALILFLGYMVTYLYESSTVHAIRGRQSTNP